MRLLQFLVCFWFTFTASANDGTPSCAVDFVFVVGATSLCEGIGDVDFDVQKQYILDAVDRLAQSAFSASHRVGVVMYEREQPDTVLMPLGRITYYPQLLRAVNGISRAPGRSRTAKSLELAISTIRKRGRKNAPKAVITITDGYSRDFVDLPAASLRSMPNVHSYAVSPFKPVLREELDIITGSAKRVFTKPGSFPRILRHLNGACIRNPDGHGLKLPVYNSRNLQYWATPKTTTSSTVRPNVASKCLLDVMFVVDASGSYTVTFKNQLRLMARTVDRLTVGQNNARVALIRFAGPRKAKALFSFNTFINAADIKKSIMATRFISGITDLVEGLELAESQFSPQFGARPNIAKPIAIVFTDGFSRKDSRPAAQSLRSKGVQIFAVGMDEHYPINRRELNLITGDSSRVFTHDTLTNLERNLNLIMRDCA